MRKQVHKDTVYIPWYRYLYGERVFNEDAVCYFDHQLRCWFAIYRQGRFEYEAAAFTDYPLAYERLQKVVGNRINLPPLEEFYFYENFNLKFVTHTTLN